MAGHMEKELLEYSVDDYPQYLSGLSRALLRCLLATFLETAVTTTCSIQLLTT